MFDATIPRVFAQFLDNQDMVIVGAEDQRGMMWASTMAGRPGFVDAVDDRTVVIDRVPPMGDPLRDAFETTRDIGILALQPQVRRRIRINGKAVRNEADQLVVRTEQVLGNCPKYLQTRTVERIDEALAPRPLQATSRLTEQQSEWISGADTFFIASQSPDHGADASSRGGMPGFVHVESTSRLRWPDYTGNQFYMTLGNVHLNPAVGLLFVDWERGHTLQLSGRASVDWDQDSALAYPGALRVIEFDIEAVVQIDHASPLRWTLHEYSRFNPPSA